MLRHALTAACGLSVCLATSVSFAQVTLERKIEEGSSYRTETTARLEQKLIIAGMDVDTSSNTRGVNRSTVGKRDGQGNLKVEEAVESLTVSMEVMGQAYHFDSANPENKGESPLEILRDVHKGLAKQKTTTAYDKFNRVTSVERELDIGNSLPTEVQSLVKSQLDPTNLKNAANEELDQIKSDPIKKGDTWQRARTGDFGGGQAMTFQTEYTYACTVDKDGRTLDKIASKVLSVNFALNNSPLPLTLKDSDLKVPESEGVILFDRQRGQIVDSTQSMRFTGEMTFTINGMDLPAKLDLKMQTAGVVKF